MIILEFYRFHHGLDNHYNLEDVIKEGKYCIFVALTEGMELHSTIRVDESFY